MVFVSLTGGSFFGSNIIWLYELTSFLSSNPDLSVLHDWDPDRKPRELYVHLHVCSTVSWSSHPELTLNDKYLHYNGYIPYNGQKRMQ